MIRFVFATLLLAPLGLVRAEQPADPAATKLLADARAARAVWAKFPGFSAAVAVNLDGVVSSGHVAVAADGTVRFTGLEPAAEKWAKSQLGSVVAHRLDDGSTPHDTPAAFTDDVKAHPLGRGITVLNDELHSSYRIRDTEIVEVNRIMKDARFTITVLHSVKNAEGKILTTDYVVNYWDPTNGALTRSVSHHESWVREGTFDLPEVALVLTARPGQASSAEEAGKILSSRTLSLSKHQLK